MYSSQLEGLFPASLVFITSSAPKGRKWNSDSGAKTLPDPAEPTLSSPLSRVTSLGVSTRFTKLAPRGGMFRRFTVPPYKGNRDE